MLLLQQAESLHQLLRGFGGGEKGGFCLEFGGARFGYLAVGGDGGVGEVVSGGCSAGGAVAFEEVAGSEGGEAGGGGDGGVDVGDCKLSVRRERGEGAEVEMVAGEDDVGVRGAGVVEVGRGGREALGWESC